MCYNRVTLMRADRGSLILEKVGEQLIISLQRRLNHAGTMGGGMRLLFMASRCYRGTQHRSQRVEHVQTRGKTNSWYLLKEVVTEMRW